MILVVKTSYCHYIVGKNTVGVSSELSLLTKPDHADNHNGN